jgi:secreted trypsin-like serine protease
MLPFISTVLITSSLSTPHVVGGTPVKPGVWPDAVAVLARNAACTGTLIAPDVVLTAGHCIETDPVVVVVDTVDYGQPGGEPIRVARAEAYPDWQHTYDVGVVVLAHPARAKPRAIAAACTVRSGLVEGAQLHLVGFGLTSRAGTGDNSRLHEGRIPVVDPTCTADPACNPAVAPGGEFTAGGRGVDSCFGDSGGPVYLDTAAGPALVGVVSRAYAVGGPPCGEGGVYVRADKVAAWIERLTHAKLARTACKGAADDGEAADEPTGSSGGCAAGGSGASLVLAIGVVGLATRRRRSSRAQMI